MGHVALVGCEDPFGRELARQLASDRARTLETFPTLQAAFKGATAQTVDVVVSCPSVPAGDVLRFAATLSEAGLAPGVVMVVADVTTDLLRSAIKAGIRDVLPASDGIDAIVAAVTAADDAASRRKTSGPSPAAEAEDKPAVALGKVVTVFSTKGGVGKSVIATNLGAALASGLGRSTVLVDLDLQFGDVSCMLQMPPERTIFDAVQAFDRLDAQMLQGFVLQHSSGLSALLAPVRPEEAESVTTARITQILGLLRQLAEFVVVDTPASLSEVVLTALEQSDRILAIATLDVPSVKNTKVSLQKLEQLGLGNGSVRLVLNRADSKVWLEPHEIEKALSDRIVARIPSDRLVPRSVNKGVPVVLDAPRSAVAKSMVALAREVASS